MAEILKTNVCCLDLNAECIDYLKSLDLNVYEGTLGSVFSIKWGRNSYRDTKPVLVDVDFPVNLHEYHVFIHDMDNPTEREYDSEEHIVSQIKDSEARHLVCKHPVNKFDLRPYGTKRLFLQFRDESIKKRIEILFVGQENYVEYNSNVFDGSQPYNMGNLSNIEEWGLLSGKEKIGKRVQVEDNGLSKCLFESRLNQVRFCRVFYKPTEMNGEERMIDRNFISLLSNESGECVSYIYCYSKDYIKFVIPQVEDKAGVLKDIFDNVLFKYFSDFFPDVEARNWINNETYLLPEELVIKQKIESKRKELEKEIAKLEEDEKNIRDKSIHIKHLLTESGSALVKAVKIFLENLGFENVVDKDETLKEGELKEEDLYFTYEGNHIYMEVKGINGTSTDAECSQVDKIVNRRMRELKTTDVHGIYMVNHQRNIEPLKRQIPPFNDTQISDAENQSRTLVYTSQLYALYSDIENGLISREQARESLLQIGLANFHCHLKSLGMPYSYYQDGRVICIELFNEQLSIGDTLFYKDSLQRLVSLKIESLQQDGRSFDSVKNGKTGIKIDKKVPRNKEIYR